jgi:hypothetical protein
VDYSFVADGELGCEGGLLSVHKLVVLCSVQQCSGSVKEWFSRIRLNHM